jgi:CheY-like chemotaxis protein
VDAETYNADKILLVEDDPMDAEMTMAALKESHLADQVAVVRDGAEALDYLYRRGKFQTRLDIDPVLVLLDNKMPKVNGLQVLKSMKADERLKTIPVVAFTSSPLASDLTEFYQNGVNAYVVKPVGFGEFVAAIKQLVAFWMAVNLPPPVALKRETGVQNGSLAFLGKPKAANEKHPPLAVLGNLPE